jgi:protein arginine kinase activator
MKCDHCDQEATVHEVLRKGGQTVEKHLCEQCARKQGMAVQQVPISELIHKYVLSQPTSEARAAATKTCQACGTTYAEFKQSGLLGCPDCYGVFEPSLGPLLERTHEGGTHHVGKSPSRRAPADASPRAAAATPAAQPAVMTAPAVPKAQPRSDAAQRAQRILLLQKQLEEAVKAEQYERAAALRDQIRTLAQAKGPAGPGAPA